MYIIYIYSFYSAEADPSQNRKDESHGSVTLAPLVSAIRNRI